MFSVSLVPVAACVAAIADSHQYNEHRWAVPSAIWSDTHKEITVRQILHHLGLFSSDAALESKILAFFAQRAALALSQVSHLTDTTDSSCFVLDSWCHADPLVSCASPPTNWLRIRSDLLVPRSFKPLSPHSWTSVPQVGNPLQHMFPHLTQPSQYHLSSRLPAGRVCVRSCAREHML